MKKEAKKNSNALAKPTVNSVSAPTPLALAIKQRRRITRVVLREELIGMLADLRAKRIDPKVAKEGANLVGKVLAGERLALDYYGLRKEKPPRLVFIEAR